MKIETASVAFETIFMKIGTATMAFETIFMKIEAAIMAFETTFMKIETAIMDFGTIVTHSGPATAGSDAAGRGVAMQVLHRRSAGVAGLAVAAVHGAFLVAGTGGHIRT